MFQIKYLIKTTTIQIEINGKTTIPNLIKIPIKAANYIKGKTMIIQIINERIKIIKDIKLVPSFQAGSTSKTIQAKQSLHKNPSFIP